jgi:hypothetical protein
LTTVTKPGNVRLDYYYDELGRVNYVSNGGTGGTLYANYLYDVNSQPVIVYDRLKDFAVNGTDDIYAWNYQYDTVGRMTREDLVTSGSGSYYSLGRLQLKYDKAGGGQTQLHCERRVI